jgi:GT2 family glycosyltransferase
MVEWIDSSVNLGFGKGCNLAEKRAKNPYLFFINPDTIVSTNALREILHFMEEYPDSGTVGCRILNEDGSMQWSCRRSFPTELSAISKTLGLTALFPKSKLLSSYNMTYANPDEITEVDAISGSFFCIRRELYEQLNGFDEDFFMYGEDLDLCFRAKAAGFRNYYTPITNVLHFRGQSSRTRRVKSYIDFYQAMWIFVKKHRSYYLVPRFLIFIGIVIAAIVGVFSRLVPQFWKFFLDGGVLVLWAMFFLDIGKKQDLRFAISFAALNILFLVLRGEYVSSSLDDKRSLPYLILVNLSVVGIFAGYCIFTLPQSYDWHWGLTLCLSSLIVPLLFLLWRRVLFWFNYFYRIFAKKRHRSILLGGREDSLQPWFDNHNVIPGVEILGCVSGEVQGVTPENRRHLLGSVEDIQDICNRTDCRELLVVSNFSGYHEPFDLQRLEKLGMKVFLLVGKGKSGNFALINLKYLH